MKYRSVPVRYTTMIHYKKTNQTEGMHKSRNRRTDNCKSAYAYLLAFVRSSYNVLDNWLARCYDNIR